MITITTFGYLHGDPPEAHLTADLRKHFRDPHVSPELRYLTAEDKAVRDAVMNTPGIRPLVKALAWAVLAYQDGPSSGPVSVSVGCAGGRHRAATVGMSLASLLGGGRDVHLVHRDMAKPVVNRQS